MKNSPVFDPSETFSAVLKIASMLKQAGGRALLVGGCVRDALLGIPCKDFDLEIYGLSADGIIKTLQSDFGLDLVGMSFGVIKLHHLEIDLALPRTENKTGAGHRGFLVETTPDLSFSEAAARRDFTLNAVMCDPLSGEVIDPWHGIDDLKRGILRHVSSHFTEDPLRVLRAMQFAARFRFDVAPETVRLCSQIRQDELPPERLEGEWEKLLLKGTEPSRGLNFLRDCGWIRYYPELERLIGCAQNPVWHPEGDVWTHTLLALDAVPPRRTGNADDDLVLALAVLCHDFGKPATSVLCGDGAIRSHGHEPAGEQPARDFIARIWQRTDLAPRVIPLVLEHMRPMSFLDENASDRAYRRLSLAVGRMDLLRKVAECDILGTKNPGVPESLKLLERFTERVEKLSIASSVPKPLILGRHLIARGMKPGIEMGEVLKRCFEAQLDGEFTTVEEGLAWLDSAGKQ